MLTHIVYLHNLAQYHCGQLPADARVDPIGYVVPYPAPHVAFLRSSMRIQKVSWVMFHSTSINAFIAPTTVRFIACSFRQELRHSRRRASAAASGYPTCLCIDRFELEVHSRL
jgi:hypothetical protein